MQNHLLFIAALLFVVDVAARKLDIKALLGRPMVRSPDAQTASVVMRPLMERKKIAEKFRRPGNEELPALRSAAPVVPAPQPEEPASGNYIGRLKEAKKRKGSR